METANSQRIKEGELKKKTYKKTKASFITSINLGEEALASHYKTKTKIKFLQPFFIFGIEIMTELQYKYFLSTPRFNTYIKKTGDDFEKAIQLYKVNIELSEAFYPILSVLEISLRNAIHNKLTAYFDDPFWFKNKLPVAFLPFVSDATQKLSKQKKIITADQIISELNFGFWNRLFNRNHTSLLWKPLRVIFENTPKKLRQRDTIADSLYKIRTLRNRIYHYEPIFGNLSEIEKTYEEMITFLKWLNNDLPTLIEDINRFSEILEKAKQLQ